MLPSNSAGSIGIATMLPVRAVARLSAPVPPTPTPPRPSLRDGRVGVSPPAGAVAVERVLRREAFSVAGKAISAPRTSTSTT